MSIYLSVKATLEKEFDEIVDQDRRSDEFSYATLQHIIEIGWENMAIPCSLAKSIDQAVQKVEESLKQTKLFNRLVDRAQPGGGCYDPMYDYVVFYRNTCEGRRLEVHRSNATGHSSFDVVNPKLYGVPRDGFFFQVSGRPFKWISEEQAKLDTDISVLSCGSTTEKERYEYLILRVGNRLIFGGRSIVSGYLLSNYHPNVIDVNDPKSYVPITSYHYHGDIYGSPEDSARNLFHKGYWVRGVLDMIKEGVLTWVEPSIKRPNSKPRKDNKAIAIKRNITIIRRKKS